jgi:hypothetical protein
LVRDQEVPGSNPGAPMFSFPVAVCISLLLVSSSFSGEFPGLSRMGPTGLVLAPSGDILRRNWYAAGVHQGSLKAAYGLFGLAEIGFVLPDLVQKPGEEQWRTETRGFAKAGWDFRPFGRWAPAVAAGGENNTEFGHETLYGTATWDLKVFGWPVDINGGLGTGRLRNEAFGGFGVIPVSFFGYSLKFVAEYAGRQADIGARIALSRNLRLDFVMLMTAGPRSEDGNEAWLVKFDRGLLGASTTGQVKLPDPRKAPAINAKEGSR